MAVSEHRRQPAAPRSATARDDAHARLEDLYRTHAPRVRAICRSLLRDREEAEDAAQQVFVSAFRSLLRGSAPRDPEAWLATIARHESWARAHGRSVVPIQPDLPDPAQEDPPSVVARRAELADVWQAIRSLPALQREALLLRELRGLSYDELVTDLHVSHSSVRSLLNRGRTTLREQLQRGAAALTGTPWPSVFARLFGDGSSPVLPSASRAAAVGIGALVLTGSGASGPPRAERAEHVLTTHHIASAPRPARTLQPAPVGPERETRPTVVTHATPRVRVRDDRRSARSGPGSSDDLGSGRGSDSSGGPGPAADSGGSGDRPASTADASASSGDGGPGPSSPTTAVTGTSDGSGSGRSSGSDGASSGSGGGSSSSDGGSSSSDGGSGASGRSGGSDTAS